MNSSILSRSAWVAGLFDNNRMCPMRCVLETFNFEVYQRMVRCRFELLSLTSRRDVVALLIAAEVMFVSLWACACPVQMRLHGTMECAVEGGPSLLEYSQQVAPTPPSPPLPPPPSRSHCLVLSSWEWCYWLVRLLYCFTTHANVSA